MSALVMSLRSTAQNPARVLSVWLFCVAAITFWVGVLYLLEGISGPIAGLLIGGLGLGSVPLSSHLILIIWPPEEGI
jgi:hypothetical protein